jgi:hypothetical protein
VLRIESRGEHHLWLSTLTEAGEHLSVLKRQSSRGTSVDVFDVATIEHRGDGSFLSQYELQHRRSKLATSYPRLSAASAIARQLSSCLPDLPPDPRHWQRTLLAFGALEAGHPVDAVCLKYWFVFARDEGYPVVEDWLQGLPPHEQTQARHLLNTPLNSMSEAGPMAQTHLESLLGWLQQATELLG